MTRYAVAALVTLDVGVYTISQVGDEGVGEVLVERMR